MTSFRCVFVCIALLLGSVAGAEEEKILNVYNWGNFIGPTTRGATTITIAHISFSMAYVAIIVRSRLNGMDQSLEDAAMDLGGRPLRVFFDITVPTIAPAMVAGWLLAFTLSLDDLVIASFVSGPGSTTLPMLIFSKVRRGVTPDINALATVIIVLVTIGVIMAALVMRKKDRSSEAENA